MRRAGVDAHIITQDERWWALEAAGIARGSRRPYEGTLEQTDTGLSWATVQLPSDAVRYVGHREALRLLHDDAHLGAASRWLAQRVERGTFGLSRYVTDNLHRILAGAASARHGVFRDEPLAGRRGSSALRGRFIVGVQYLETRPTIERAAAFAAMVIRQRFYDLGNEELAVLMMNGTLAADGYEPVTSRAALGAASSMHGDVTELMCSLLGQRR